MFKKSLFQKKWCEYFSFSGNLRVFLLVLQFTIIEDIIDLIKCNRPLPVLHISFDFFLLKLKRHFSCKRQPPEMAEKFGMEKIVLNCFRFFFRLLASNTEGVSSGLRGIADAPPPPPLKDLTPCRPKGSPFVLF